MGKSDSDLQAGGSVAEESPATSLNLGITVGRSALDALLREIRRVVREVVREEIAAIDVQCREAAPPEARGGPNPRGVELPAIEPLRARDLREAYLLGKLPEDVGPLIDTEQAAKLLGINRRTLERFLSAGAIPEPIRLAGRIRRWRATELLEWIEAGCPHPKHWSYQTHPAARAKGRRPPRS